MARFRSSIPRVSIKKDPLADRLKNSQQQPANMGPINQAPLPQQQPANMGPANQAPLPQQQPANMGPINQAPLPQQQPANMGPVNQAPPPPPPPQPVSENPSVVQSDMQSIADASRAANQAGFTDVLAANQAGFGNVQSDVQSIADASRAANQAGFGNVQSDMQAIADASRAANQAGFADIASLYETQADRQREREDELSEQILAERREADRLQREAQDAATAPIDISGLSDYNPYAAVEQREQRRQAWQNIEDARRANAPENIGDGPPTTPLGSNQGPIGNSFIDDATAQGFITSNPPFEGMETLFNTDQRLRDAGLVSTQAGPGAGALPEVRSQDYALGAGALPEVRSQDYASGAGALPEQRSMDYSTTGAAQRVAESTGEQSDLISRLNQMYQSRLGDSDPIFQSQLADQQRRNQEQERQTMEQLSRLGIVRGGGDTASVLSDMREGQERNRLALEASSQDRRDQMMRDALGFEQGRAELGITGAQEAALRGAEGRAQETQLSELYGKVGEEATLRGQEFNEAQALRAAERRALGSREERADAELEARLFGETGFGRGPLERPRQTLGGQEFKERQLLSEAERLAIGGREGRADTELEARLFGETNLGRGPLEAPRQTLGFRQFKADEDLQRARAEQIRGSEERAGGELESRLFGETRYGVDNPMLGPAATLGGRAAEQELEAGEQDIGIRKAEDIRRQQMTESDLFGQVKTGANMEPIQTLEGQRAIEDKLTSRLDRRLAEAQETGELDGATTLRGQAARSDLASDDLTRRIAESDVTGKFRTAENLRPEETQAARALQSELDTAAVNRAATEAGVTGRYQAEFGGEEKPGDTLENRLRSAQLLGQLGEDRTLAGEEMDMTKIAAALSAIDPSLDTQYSSVAEALMGDAAGNYQYGMMRDRLQGDSDYLPTGESLAEKYGAPIERAVDLGERGIRIYFKNGKTVIVNLDGEVTKEPRRLGEGDLSPLEQGMEQE